MAKMKLKTHSGAKKRFKLTKNGKIKRGHAFRSHILTKKTTRTHTALGFAYLEACADKSAALRREIALKKLTKAQKEALCAGWTAEKE